jgi:DNA/RNA endonuclease G (NUC1)
MLFKTITNVRNRKEPFHAMKSTSQSSFMRKLFAILVGASALFFIVLQVGATIGTSLQMQLGNPTGATADPNNHDHYLIQRTVEALDYSDNLGEPNWASWDLTAADEGSAARSTFITDTNLPPCFYAVTTGDYTGSGYDRGQMCPSADRTDTQSDNDQVFYMSNVIPQTPDNNEGVWESFEAYCRTLAQSGNELLITCGPGTFDGSRIQPSGKVSIPGYTWKIVVVVPPGPGSAISRITSSTRVIAVKVPNIQGIRSVDWTSYITSVNQIQTDTGYTFFTALSPTLAAQLRATVDGQGARAANSGSASPAEAAVEQSVAEASGIMPLTSGQTRTVRIVEYNIECDTGTITPLPGLIAPSSGNVTNGGVLEGIGEEIIGSDPAQPLDILALNETTSNTSTVQPIVNALNAFYAYYNNPAGYAMSTYQATESGGDPTTGNGPNALVYNTNTLQLIASVPVDPPGGTSQLGSASGMYREVMRYEFAPAGVTAGTNNEFYIYVSHYKASSGSGNEKARLGEATIIRSNEYLNLPANARVLYVGDYNPDDNSVEPGYQTICSNGVPNVSPRTSQGQGVDPLNILWGPYTSAATNINWGSSTTSTSILFMLTDASTGIKYRDDLQIMTSNVYYDVAGGLQYVQGSFHAFGNNGSFTYGSSVNSSGNTALKDLDATLTNLYKLSASTLLADLTTASDHLPTVADYTVPIGSGGTAPSITSFSPTSGPVGTNVVITGSAFTGATAVKFNGTAATSFTVNSDTQITATVPTGATTGPISVTTANGTGTSSTNFTVTAPAPSITSFSPTSGPVGTNVVITGSAFTGATAVKFNGTAATSFTVNSDTQITATVPTGATTGPISVTTSAGTGTSSTSFTVTAPPAPSITSFSPTSGPVGTNVVITGSAFTGATAVKFNGTAATSFTVNSDTQITATVPTGATTGPISVTTSAGTGTSSTNFTVTAPAPSITSFSPTSGPVGTNVVITGSAFTGATAVKFNGTAATSFTVNSDTQITATVPTGATTGTISVTTANGTGTSSTSFTVTSSGGSLNISQVYGGGGNSGATYKNDFIELYNASSAAVNLSTYAVQYASASGSSWQETTLSGTIQPGHYYLIQEAAGSGGTSNLPSPEATGTINMSATAGKVALTKTQTLLTVDNPVSNTNVVDFVGYGSADAYEGSGPAPAPSNTTSDLRAGNGAINTYNNASDFSTGAPNPRN